MLSYLSIKNHFDVFWIRRCLSPVAGVDYTKWKIFAFYS